MYTPRIYDVYILSQKLEQVLANTNPLIHSFYVTLLLALYQIVVRLDLGLD